MSFREWWDRKAKRHDPKQGGLPPKRIEDFDLDRDGKLIGTVPAPVDKLLRDAYESGRIMGKSPLWFAQMPGYYRVTVATQVNGKPLQVAEQIVALEAGDAITPVIQAERLRGIGGGEDEMPKRKKLPVPALPAPKPDPRSPKGLTPAAAASIMEAIAKKYNEANPFKDRVFYKIEGRREMDPMPVYKIIGSAEIRDMDTHYAQQNASELLISKVPDPGRVFADMSENVMRQVQDAVAKLAIEWGWKPGERDPRDRRGDEDDFWDILKKAGGTGKPGEFGDGPDTHGSEGDEKGQPGERKGRPKKGDDKAGRQPTPEDQEKEDRAALVAKMGKAFEWEKYQEEIPALPFEGRWVVQPLPPIAGAMVRFRIRTKFWPKTKFVSVYLDTHEMLGTHEAGPYWEVFDGESCERVPMKEVKDVMSTIEKAVEKLEVK